LLGQCVPTEAYFPILDSMLAEQDSSYERLEAIPENFQQVLDAMSPPQAAVWWADQAGYREFMIRHGLPASKIDACLSDKPARDALDHRNYHANVELGVMGVPCFVINGRNLQHVNKWAELEPLLQSDGA